MAPTEMVGAFLVSKRSAILRLLLVAVGGAFGAVGRYLVDGWIIAADSVFPLGTMVINISGSFGLGLFYTLAVDRFAIPTSWRLIIAIGFFGAYTTFSTFSYETFKLIEEGAALMAFLNLALSVVGALVALYIGTVIGRLI